MLLFRFGFKYLIIRSLSVPFCSSFGPVQHLFYWLCLFLFLHQSLSVPRGDESHLPLIVCAAISIGKVRVEEMLFCVILKFMFSVATFFARKNMKNGLNFPRFHVKACPMFFGGCFRIFF